MYCLVEDATDLCRMERGAVRHTWTPECTICWGYILAFFCRSQLGLAAAIAPLDEFFDGREVPGFTGAGADAEDEVGDACFDETVAGSVVVFGFGSAAAFNFVGITPDLFTPVVKYLHFVGNGFVIAEAVPHVGILSGEA